MELWVGCVTGALEEREFKALLTEVGFAGADIRRLMYAAVAARFGEARPLAPVQWLSDHGGMYTALETVICAERLGLAPVTTPAYSPESNGMAEALVHTLKRDYVSGADLSSAAVVLDQLPVWIADYNGRAPHSALGYRPPLVYRAEWAATAAVEIVIASVRRCLANWGALQVRIHLGAVQLLARRQSRARRARGRGTRAIRAGGGVRERCRPVHGGDRAGER